MLSFQDETQACAVFVRSIHNNSADCTQKGYEAVLRLPVSPNLQQFTSHDILTAHTKNFISLSTGSTAYLQNAQEQKRNPTATCLPQRKHFLVYFGLEWWHVCVVVYLPLFHWHQNHFWKDSENRRNVLERLDRVTRLPRFILCHNRVMPIDLLINRSVFRGRKYWLNNNKPCRAH